MDLNEIYKKVGFGNTNETEAETETAQVVETKPETEEAPVAETEPETEEAPAAETEPETEETTAAETEPETEEAPAAETEPETEETPAVETESETEESPVVKTESISDSEEHIKEFAEDAADVLTAVQVPLMKKVAALNDKLENIDAKVSSLRKLADMHQEIENNLNNQINEYKDNFYRRIVNPILVEFFDLHEDMNAEALQAEEETAKVLIEYVNMITSILKHYGVTVETVSIGDAYDTRIHRPVKAVPTEDKTLDRTIVKTVKTLVHSIDGKVTERAGVHVYQYQENNEQE